MKKARRQVRLEEKNKGHFNLLHRVKEILSANQENILFIEQENKSIYVKCDKMKKILSKQDEFIYNLLERIRELMRYIKQLKLETMIYISYNIQSTSHQTKIITRQQQGILQSLEIKALLKVFLSIKQNQQHSIFNRLLNQKGIRSLEVKTNILIIKIGITISVI